MTSDNLTDKNYEPSVINPEPRSPSVRSSMGSPSSQQRTGHNAFRSTENYLNLIDCGISNNVSRVNSPSPNRQIRFDRPFTPLPNLANSNTNELYIGNVFFESSPNDMYSTNNGQESILTVPIDKPLLPQFTQTCERTRSQPLTLFVNNGDMKRSGILVSVIETPKNSNHNRCIPLIMKNINCFGIKKGEEPHSEIQEKISAGSSQLINHVRPKPKGNHGKKKTLKVHKKTPAPRMVQIYCQCKKSNCLKMYCHCFKNNVACSPGKCNCVGCQNDTKNNISFNSHKIQKGTNRQVHASQKSHTQHAHLPHSRPYPREKKAASRGCHCQKSQCKKGYCDCYSRNLLCVADCQCINCHNGKQS